MNFFFVIFEKSTCWLLSFSNYNHIYSSFLFFLLREKEITINGQFYLGSRLNLRFFFVNYRSNVGFLD